MRYGIDVPQFGDYADPRLLAVLARETEAAGWDGFFIWDHINVNWPAPVADPWIALAAIACATSRIRFGAMVTPIFRRIPWKLARETVTLDHLSEGRLIFGYGLGADFFGEISSFAGVLDDRARAAMLEEGLAVLTGLWSGEKFSFGGKYYNVRDVQFLPAPLQKPRIPIWGAGTWPRKGPMLRAAKYDGVMPMSGDIEKPLTPEQVREIARFFKEHHTSGAHPFEVIAGGETPADDRKRAREIVAGYEAAGATWWIESTLPWKQSLRSFRARIAAGPPRSQL
jgi:alkanesulfonate monooxygenase SsuD/methylene tetrahydromethanopterin reductase-like flavin-dependent oxidoreductase (luciferase family)